MDLKCLAKSMDLKSWNIYWHTSDYVIQLIQGCNSFAF